MLYGGLTINGGCIQRPLDHGQYFHAVTAPDGTFRITRPKLHSVITVFGPAGAFFHNASAGAAAVIGPEQKEATLTLHPCVQARGRLVDSSGQPVTEGSITLTVELPTPEHQWHAYCSSIAPAGDGSYVLPYTIPGVPLAIIYDKKNYPSPPVRIKSFTATPGKDLDLGDTPIPKSDHR